MTQEQRKRVEDALISMIENAPTMNFMPDNPHKSVSSEHMKAAAEVTYALTALQESATACSPNVRVRNAVGGRALAEEELPSGADVKETPRRGITVEVSEESRDRLKRQCVACVSIHVDRSELDEAITKLDEAVAKAERLQGILRREEIAGQPSEGEQREAVT